MAKKWYVGEAVEVLKSGDKAARHDIGSRFPLFATATLEEIVDVMREGKIEITVRQFEIAMRGGPKGKVDLNVDEDSDDEVVAEKPVKEVKEKKVKKEKVKDKVKAKPSKVEEEDDDDEDLEDEVKAKKKKSIDDFLDDED